MFQNGEDAMAKTAAQLRIEFETLDVHWCGPGSGASTAAASSLRGVREIWRSMNGVRDGQCETYGLSAQEIDEDVRIIKKMLNVGVQNPFDWSAC